MAPGTYRDTLNRSGVAPFMWTQFLGAFNGHLFKITVSLLVIHESSSASAGGRLSLVGTMFVLPFLVCSGWAGQLADVHNKRTVLIIAKSFEILAALFACVALVTERLDASYAVLLLFAIQAAFFSPAKYGILLEMLPVTHLSRANGLLEMSTFVAIVVGTATGSLLFGVWPHHAWRIGLVSLTLAIIGSITSCGIPVVSAAHPPTRLRLNPWTGIGEGLRHLRGNRTLCLAVFGLSYFWFLGALLQLVMVAFGTQVLRLNDRWVGGLTACAAIGIGVGSLAAGRLSRDTIEPGLVPLGSTGMGIFAILLSRCGDTLVGAAVALTFVGLCSGLFVVPLQGMLQQQCDAPQIGRLMATNNVLNMVAILLASGLLWVCSEYVGLSADRVILICGVVTLTATLGAWWFVPEWRTPIRHWASTVTSSRIVGRSLGNPS